MGRVPEIGEIKTFVPSSFLTENGGVSLLSIRPDLEYQVTGTVVYINEQHRWCRVRYETAKGTAFECFKF